MMLFSKLLNDLDTYLAGNPQPPPPSPPDPDEAKKEDDGLLVQQVEEREEEAREQESPPRIVRRTLSHVDNNEARSTMAMDSPSPVPVDLLSHPSHDTPPSTDRVTPMTSTPSGSPLLVRESPSDKGVPSLDQLASSPPPGQQPTTSTSSSPASLPDLHHHRSGSSMDTSSSVGLLTPNRNGSRQQTVVSRINSRTSSVGGGSGQAHSFERGSAVPNVVNICVACGNLWDDGGSALFPYLKCSKCNIHIHAACRSFSQNSISCPLPPNVAELTDYADARKINCPGVVTVLVKEAYELPVSEGTSLYVKLALLPWKERIKTPASDVGPGKQVVWWNELSETTATPTGQYTLVHLYNNETTPPPVLRVEIWSSALQILDQMVGYTEISMLPLMRFPKLTVERWHRVVPNGGLVDNKYQASAMILMSISFTPTKATSTQVTPVLPTMHTVRTSDSLLDTNAEPAFTDHLFKLHSYLGPTFCGVCDAILIGFTRQGYKCEVCGLNVHRQCQLQASVRQPCPGLPHIEPPKPGQALQDSTEGLKAVTTTSTKPASRSSTPMPTIASDMDISSSSAVGGAAGSTTTTTVGLTKAEISKLAGVGHLDLDVIQAHKCSSKCTKEGEGSMSSHFMDVLDGDYYCRVRFGDMKPKRTRTVYQTANPRFDESWKFVVPHYRAVLVVELIDAGRDKVVGKVELTTFQIIQQEADGIAEGKEVVLEENYPLRDGDKEVGYLRMTVGVEEDLQLFLAAEPRRVPKSPQEDLGLDNLKRVLDRLLAAVELIQTVERAYYDLMAWKNPVLTGVTMAIFVYLCLFADAERAGALIVFVFIAVLSYAFWLRRTGRFRLSFIEKDGGAQEANGPTGSRPHRVLGKLKVSVGNIGLMVPSTSIDKSSPSTPVVQPPTGKVYVVVSYALQENAVEPETDLVIGCLSNDRFNTPKDLEVEYRMPFVAAAQYMGAERGNIFRNVVEYEEPGVSQVNGGRKVTSTTTRPWFLYPILQPIAVKGAGKFESLSFTAATGAIRLRVFLETELHAFEEEYLGQVFIPVRLLAQALKDSGPGGASEVSGWFCLGEDIKESSSLKDREAVVPVAKGVGGIHMHLRLKLVIPEPGATPSKHDLQESQAFEAVLEEDINTQSGAQNVVSSIWNLPSTVKYIQNLLEEWLGYLESWKNLLNWTHPRKTAVIYAGLVVSWLMLLVVPTRYLVLMAGMYEFLYKFMPEQEEYPNVIRCENLVASVPHDEDLRRVYLAANLAFQRQLRDVRQKPRQRRAQLTGPWSSLWEGEAQTRASSDQPWRTCYVLVQGNRILWWKNERDADRGAPPEGQITLRGHAGITSASPLEVKQMGAAKAALLVCVFGKNLAREQEKRSFLTSSPEQQRCLADAVLSAIDYKQS